MSFKQFTRQFLQHTAPSRRHLTPELVLRLVTPSCPLWSARAEDSPFADPFWGFYWPGGQATARCSIKHYVSLGRKYDSYLACIAALRLRLGTQPTPSLGITEFLAGFSRHILDNRELIQHRRVLDLGCGCGAGAIAAAMMNASRVVANDIDPYAIMATKINAKLNKTKVETDTNNFIGRSCNDFDVILIGDMFYDEEFASVLFEWLHKLCADNKLVLVGDPGRHGLTERRRNQMTLLASYELPQETRDQNNGFTETSVWRLNTL